MEKQFILAFIISFAISAELPPFYHSTETIQHRLEQLSQECAFISISSASTDPYIQLLHINENEQKRYRGFLLFGEHPRELISPETGLRFIQDLCKHKSDEKMKRILDNYSLRIIVNANPQSRQIVENGSFCLRENENGVDINRNYDAHWQQVQDDVNQITSGSKPFSEPETQAVRDSLKQFNADIFLSVHSGALGMFTPHAYSAEDVEVNNEQMLNILDNLQQNYCPSCEVGSVGKEIGYLSPGSCIDYAYDELKIKYSFAFEIYSQRIDLRNELEKNQISFLQMQQQGKIRNKNKRQISASCFIQTKSHETQSISNKSCFSYFNPETMNEYDWYVRNWSTAINDMLYELIEEENHQSLN